MSQKPLPLKEERFIPFHRADIINMCLQTNELSAKEKKRFRVFCNLLQALMHFEFHHRLETLKTSYAPFNPNADTHQIRNYTNQELVEFQNRFEEEFIKLLNAANFEEVHQSSIQGSLERESLFNIRLEVNFDDFEKVIIFRRGASQQRESVKQFWGILKREVEFINFDRVVIFVKFKSQAYFDKLNIENFLFQPGSTTIKLFKNVPRGDLEMLFPNTEVRMKFLDKLMIGIPALISGALVISSKLLTSLGLILLLVAFWLGFHDEAVAIDQTALVALLGGIAAIGGYLVKQYNKFKNRKIHFLKTLTENLYFKNLDNDAGVFHRLLDTAEESETKEVILAYFFLLISTTPISKNDLDQQIEDWFSEHWECKLNFEVDDALNKLKRHQLICEENGRLSCLSIETAVTRLNAIWDRCFFDNGQPEATSPPN